jgi:hypothetical protein
MPNVATDIESAGQRIHEKGFYFKNNQLPLVYPANSFVYNSLWNEGKKYQE